jgi:Ca2+ transporting ATPase
MTASYGHGHSHPVVGRSGQILWIRGLTRLQTQIRVVNAFRHGVDSQQLQQATSNPNIQRVLQKQASLNKRLSTASAVSEPPAAAAAESLLNSHIVQQVPTKSHTETAV